MHTRFSLNYLVLLLSLLSVDASTILQRLSFSPLDPFYIVNNEKDIYLVGQVDGNYVQTGTPKEESTSKGKFIVINQYSEEYNTSKHLFSDDGDVSISPSSGVTMSNDGELHLCGHSEKHVYPIESESDDIEDHEVFYASLSGDWDIVRAKGEQCMGITTNSSGDKFFIVLERLDSPENSDSYNKLVLYHVLNKIDDPIYILDAKKSIELFKIYNASIKVLSVKVEDNLFKMLFSIVEEEGGKIERQTISIVEVAKDKIEIQTKTEQYDIELKTEYNFTMTLEKSHKYEFHGAPNVDRPLTAKTNDHLYFINHYTTTLFDFKLYFLSLESLPITDTNDEPTSAQDTNDEPTSTQDTNDEPTSTQDTNDEPTSTQDTNDEPTSAEDTNDEPTSTQDTNDEPTSAQDTNDEPTSAQDANDEPTSANGNETTEPHGSNPKNTEMEGNSSYLNSWAMFGLVFLVLMAFSYMIWRYFHQSGFGVLGTLCRSLKNKMFKGVATEPPGNHKEDFKNAREFYL